MVPKQPLLRRTLVFALTAIGVASLCVARVMPVSADPSQPP